MQEYTVKHRRFVFEGNEVLRFSSSVPKFEGYENIEGFYSELSGLCERWCEEVKFPELCERLRAERREGSPLPRRMIYRFDAKVTELADGIAEVRIEVSLSHSARNAVPQYTDTQRWELMSGNLCGSGSPTAIARSSSP